MLYGIVILATFLAIKIINFRLHKALDMNPEEDEEEEEEEEAGKKTREEEEEEEEKAEKKMEEGGSEEEGERRELGLDGKLVEQSLTKSEESGHPLLPGQVSGEVEERGEEEEEEEEEDESMRKHRDSASTLGHSSTYHSSQETAELHPVSSGTGDGKEEGEKKEEGGGATAVESLLGMIEAEVEVRRGKDEGDSPQDSSTAKTEDVLVIQVDASSGTDLGPKQSSGEEQESKGKKWVF